MRSISPATTRYNCLAWVAGENFRNWWPDSQGVGYWPPGAVRTETTQALLQAYGTLGFTLCFDGTLEAGLEKMAIYRQGAAGTEIPTHAALQLEDGKWTSKFGPCEDIIHTTADVVCGPVYGRVLCYLARPRRRAEPPAR